MASVFRKILIPNALSSLSTSSSSSSLSKDKIFSYIKEDDITFKQIHTTKNIRCYCISDLHADSERNQFWIQENLNRKVDDNDYYTILIIPGDIGSEMNKVIRVFSHVADSYDLVCYLPGNHELWKRGSLKSRKNESADSLIKFNEVIELAKKYYINVGPVRVTSTFNTNSNELECIVQDRVSSLCIFPLYSWYHSSFDTEPDLTHPFYLQSERELPFVKRWGDFELCSWPNDLIKHEDFATINSNKKNVILAEAFAEFNEKFLTPLSNEYTDEVMIAHVGNTTIEYAAGAQISEGTRIKAHGSPLVQENDTVISFSHFLPRLELCPEKRFLLEPLLSKVVGSNPLEYQIRRLRPHIHLFGHTHIPCDLDLEGISYLQWPLGYARESEKQCGHVVLEGPILVYDSSINGISQERPSKASTWSKYYVNHKRYPDVLDPSPWLLAKLNNSA